ncbi:MAG: hypothetical protein JNL88_04055 [Bacteroidia bacterium]|nr:hypothetical protein [Bacteroidia bacterium]
MEVHHHAHASHGKKNWKSYVREFIMLFLAVFCGFLAEYQLEHKIERERAGELARSFFHELKNDSLTAAVKVQNRLKQEAALQYMIAYFRDSSLSDVPKAFALNFVYGISFLSPSQFEPRTIMLDQLRNSGSLRYFKNEEFLNLTGDLAVAIKNIYHRQEIEGNNRFQYINPIVIKHYDFDFDAELKKNGRTIFDATSEYENSDQFIPFHLNNPDQVDRKGIASLLSFFKENVVSSTRKTHIQKYREINARLMQILREEYELE